MTKCDECKDPATWAITLLYDIILPGGKRLCTTHAKEFASKYDGSANMSCCALNERGQYLPPAGRPVRDIWGEEYVL